MPRRPNLFLIGAPKSGTTSLYEYLVPHPDVFMSALKEPFYFSVDIRGGPRVSYRYPDDEQRYLALFDEARGERWVGEASTRYLYSRKAPAAIKEFEPNSRLIAMLRNPVDMIHAMHNERVAHGEETVPDFAAAIALDDERLAGRSLPPGSNELGATYRPRARYGEQLQLWLEHFDRSAVHVIVFEDFIADTPGAYRKVLEFLDIDAEFQPPEFAVHNPSHRPRGGVVRSAVASRLGQFVAHRALPTVLGEHRSDSIKRRFRHSRLNRQPNPRPTLPPELRAQLEDDLSPDVALLSKLLDRDMATFWFGDSAARQD